MGGCAPLDMICQGTNLVNSILEGFASAFSVMGYSMVSGAFEGGAGTIQNNEWSVATAMTSRWGLVLLVVVVGVTLVQMGMALVQGRPQQAASAFVVGVCTWPITIFTVWLTVQLTDATDRLSIGILSAGGNSGSEVITKMFELSESTPDMVDVSFKGLITLVMVCGAFLGGLMLSFMLAFRNFALLVLVGFAPVAFMGMPLNAARAVAVRWVGLVVSLIIAKPLAAGILVMANELLVGASSEGNGWYWQWLVSLVAMAMAAFAPVITMRLFSFVGGDNAAAMGSHGSSVVTNTGTGIARGGQSVVGIVK